MKYFSFTLSLSTALLVAGCSEPVSEKSEAQETADKQTKEVPVAALEPADSIDAGLDIGSEIPKNVMVKTSDGETTLDKALGDGSAILIFTRSVEWCPYCQTQLKSVNGIVGDLKEKGYQVFGVSYDSPDKQDRFAMNQMLDYKMLSDEKSSAIDAFQLRDPQYTEGRAMGVPYASVIVVNKDGKIAAKSVSGDYKKRPTNDQILSLLSSI